jgi:hypothetical protein
MTCEPFKIFLLGANSLNINYTSHKQCILCQYIFTTALLSPKTPLRDLNLRSSVLQADAVTHAPRRHGQCSFLPSWNIKAFHVLCVWHFTKKWQRYPAGATTGTLLGQYHCISFGLKKKSFTS